MIIEKFENEVRWYKHIDGEIIIVIPTEGGYWVHKGEQLEFQAWDTPLTASEFIRKVSGPIQFLNLGRWPVDTLFQVQTRIDTTGYALRRDVKNLIFPVLMITQDLQHEWQSVELTLHGREATDHESYLDIVKVIGSVPLL